MVMLAVPLPGVTSVARKPETLDVRRDNPVGVDRLVAAGGNRLGNELVDRADDVVAIGRRVDDCTALEGRAAGRPETRGDRELLSGHIRLSFV